MWDWTEASRALSSVGLGATAALLLSVFYRQVREEWPTAYATMSSRYDLFRTRFAIWHFIQRTMPLFATSVAAAHVAPLVHGSSDVSVAVLALGHIAATNGRGIVEARRLRHKRFEVTLYQMALIPFLALSAWLGAIASDRFSKLLPTGIAVRDGFWVALIVVLAPRALVIIGARMTSPTESLVQAARPRLSSEIELLVVEVGREQRVPISLMRAIVYAEVLQRPRWIRRLEHVKGKFRPRGTYGVAQIAADSPISDSESVEGLGMQLAGTLGQLDALPEPLRAEYAKAILERHNLDRNFTEVATSILEELVPWSSKTSDRVAADGRASLDVTTVERVGFAWRIEGTSYAAIPEVRLGGHDAKLDVQANVQDPYDADRIAWCVDVPLETASLTIGRGQDLLEVQPLEDRTTWR